MRLLAPLFIAILGLGCSTSPVKYSDAVEVPEARRFSAYEKYAAPDREAANVVIIRDSGFTGSAVSLPVYIDGNKIAEIYVSESISLTLTSGDHFIGITQGGPGSEESRRRNLDEQVLNVKTGEKYFYRVGVLVSKGLILQRSSQLN